MPKSCLLVFPHCERKRQNSPFQIGTFHFRFFFSSLPLRFNISYLPTFFPKQVYLYGVLNKNSVNRYWVAMALSHRKRPMQFVSSYSFEKVAVLGRIILLLPPGLHSWHALRLRSGCSGPPGYTMLYTCLPLVSTGVPLVSYSPACRMMCLMCLNSTHHLGSFLTSFLPSLLPSFLPSFLPLPSFLSRLFFLILVCFFEPYLFFFDPYFPTCQVRVVRFYHSCSPPPPPPPPYPPPPPPSPPASPPQQQSSSSLAVASGSNWATASNWVAV